MVSRLSDRVANLPRTRPEAALEVHLLRTDNLRRQHDVALSLVGSINASIAAIGEEPTASSIFELTMALAKLDGMLRIHFAQEDQHLYPSMMASPHGTNACRLASGS